MELLSPAGSFDALRAAVQNGADAVYLGTRQFNARRFAGNFSDIEQAVSYAHLRGCRVYFVLNTLVLDRELAAWADQVGEAARAGVDAFILQDIGGARVVKRICPDIPMHASTQMTTTNHQAAQNLRAIGFSRVILARELTEEQIARVSRESGVETEVFVHGALCVCYSGQCLMSSMLGGRSANRGECAQPCRLSYDFAGKNGHLLSTKDICLANDIERLKNAGVASLKIEGRMKKPEYVGAVTRVYRKALDGRALCAADMDMLKLAFNRGGFTEGMFSQAKNRLYSAQPGHLGVYAGSVTDINKNTLTLKADTELAVGDELSPAAPEAKPAKIKAISRQGGALKITLSSAAGFKKGGRANLLSRASQEADIAASLGENRRKTPLFAKIELTPNEASTLFVNTAGGLTASAVSNTPAQAALNRALTEADVLKQLGKTGDSPFYFERVDVALAADTAFPVSGLNALRREALDSMSARLLDSFRRDAAEYTPSASERLPGRPRIAVQAQNADQARAAAEFADILYIPVDAAWADEFISREYVETAGVYPHIVNDGQLAALSALAERFPRVMLGGLVSVDKPKLGDFGLNVFNSEALAALRELGFCRAALSPELNAAQINSLRIPDGMETEIFAYGRTTLMITEHCPVDCGGKGCAASAGGAFLTDRKGMRFPIIYDGPDCRVRILNSLPVYIADMAAAVKADVFRLVFTLETPEICADIAKKYRAALDGSPPEKLQYEGEFTRGHLNRGVSSHKSEKGD